MKHAKKMGRTEMINYLKDECAKHPITCRDCPLVNMCNEKDLEDFAIDEIFRAYCLVSEAQELAEWSKVNTEESEKPVNTPFEENEGNEKTTKVNTVEHDGCSGCKYEDQSEGIYPCNACTGIYADEFERELHDDLYEPKAPEMVKHPDHYNRPGAMECWDEMELIWGREALIQWCIMTSYKYRYRAGLKGNSEEDLQKSDFYLRKAMELKEEDDA